MAISSVNVSLTSYTHKTPATFSVTFTYSEDGVPFPMILDQGSFPVKPFESGRADS